MLLQAACVLGYFAVGGLVLKLDKTVDRLFPPKVPGMLKPEGGWAVETKAKELDFGLMVVLCWPLFVVANLAVLTTIKLGGSHNAACGAYMFALIGSNLTSLYFLCSMAPNPPW